MAYPNGTSEQQFVNLLKYVALREGVRTAKGDAGVATLDDYVNSGGVLPGPRGEISQTNALVEAAMAGKAAPGWNPTTGEMHWDAWACFARYYWLLADDVSMAEIRRRMRAGSSTPWDEPGENTDLPPPTDLCGPDADPDEPQCCTKATAQDPRYAAAMAPLPADKAPEGKGWGWKTWVLLGAGAVAAVSVGAMLLRKPMASPRPAFASNPSRKRGVRKTWKEGERVIYDPTPVSHLMYTRPPEHGEAGTVTSHRFGPGDRLVFVSFDRSGGKGIAPYDLVEASYAANPSYAARMAPTAAIRKSEVTNSIVDVEVDDAAAYIRELFAAWDGDIDYTYTGTDEEGRRLTDVWGWTSSTSENEQDWRLMLHEGAAETYDENPSQTELPGKWRRGLWTFDYMDTNFPGWTDGTTWNGWPVVAVTETWLRRLAGDVGSKILLDADTKDAFIKYEQGDIDRFPARKIGPDTVYVLEGWTPWEVALHGPYQYASGPGPGER